MQCISSCTGRQWHLLRSLLTGHRAKLADPSPLVQRGCSTRLSALSEHLLVPAHNAYDDRVLHRTRVGTARALHSSQHASVQSASKHKGVRVLDDSQHPVRSSEIPAHAWPALLKLKLAGHETYIIGGSVRDLILGRQPKDVDLVTSATLPEVKRLTRHCHIVGRRFPIALIRGAHGENIEVSSLHSSASSPLDAGQIARLHAQGELQPDTLSLSWADAWKQNMNSRDFTVNAIMYDPFSHLLLDYNGGLADCAKKKLRCCKDPVVSFTEDPARMLRAVRLSSRAGLTMTTSTQAAIKQLAPTLAAFDASRLSLEVVNMFCYGASCKALLLLWQLRLLDVIMPIYAKYLQYHKVPRSAAVSSAKPGQPQPLLLQLLQLLDQQTTVDQPAPAELVFAVLATPFVDDVVSSEIYQLLNFRVGHEVLLSDLADMPQLPDGDIIAFSFLVMREGVLAWKEHHEAQPVTGCSKSAIRQRRLFKATSAAAVSCIRADMAAGVMTHAQTAAAKALLLGSWPTESKDADNIDASHEAERIVGSRKARRKRLSEPRARHDRRSDEQGQLNSLLLKTEVGWHKLLESLPETFMPTVPTRVQ